MGLFELIWVFIIYAFLGWCVEVIIATVQNRKFINRGFLNGPFCPIYGFAVLITLLLLSPVKDNILIFFICSIILVTLFELIAGYILEKSFHQKWWDYRGEQFNLKGYICLQASIAWGFACILVAYILQRPIEKFTAWASNNFGNAIAVVIIILLLVDTVVTLISLLKIKQKIRLLEDIGESIEILSDMIGQNISDDTMMAMRLTQNPTQEIEVLRQKYIKLFNKNIFGQSRISKTFPRLKIVETKSVNKKIKR